MKKTKPEAPPPVLMLAVKIAAAVKHELPVPSQFLHVEQFLDVLFQVMLPDRDQRRLAAMMFAARYVPEQLKAGPDGA